MAKAQHKSDAPGLFEETRGNSLSNTLAPPFHTNQPHQESLSIMQAARDRVVQNTVGDPMAYMYLVTYFAAVGLGLALVATSATVVTAYMSKPQGRDTLVIFAIMLICSLPLISMALRKGLVGSQSAHYIFIVCGSGGHTAEMIQMVERSIRCEKKAHRRWAVGKGDSKSFDKVLAFERRLIDRFSKSGLDCGTFDIVLFGRARYVHQSWLTTPFTAVLSLLDTIRLLASPVPIGEAASGVRFPRVIITNGPGTGFIFLLVAFMYKILGVVPTHLMRTIYVESWARVKSLSLTGKLIRRFRLADRFIVQSQAVADQSNVVAQNLLVMPTKPPVPLHVSAK
ncbi:oligosaccharide biosynthesis protein Alg14 like-domain-containing protein [Xylariaceae sp. FL1272]|nr:oligosaccharide biosynthesis protein Alg14 like-domain-containing protein [Xylariaceae sp. FL1272]